MELNYQNCLQLAPHALVSLAFVGSIFPYLNAHYRSLSQQTAHSLLALFYLVCPRCFLAVTVTSNFNVLHIFLQNFIAAAHIGIAYYIRATAKSEARDEQGIIFARAITAFMSIFTKLFVAWHVSEKGYKGVGISDWFVICSLLTDGVWFLTETLKFFLNRRTFKDEVDEMCKRTTLWLEGKGSFYAENSFYADAALSLLQAMLHFAFPNHILKLVIRSEFTLDSHHIMWCRLFGVMSLLSSIISLHARHFSPQAQIPYLASRLVTQMVIFGLNDDQFGYLDGDRLGGFVSWMSDVSCNGFTAVWGV
ncbi:unnamed protein product, partial [Mesorhabditis belari]|uniref:Uncharacterized protein n=1 Tax=Mesorhabditis belari TaxID=2138241 RepID=A0AAF3F8W2_9BILA